MDTLTNDIARAWPPRSELQARARRARALLEHCNICALRCNVNRLAGERGACGLLADTRVYKHYVSYNEEPELTPALRLFLGGCNIRCRFCDEAPQAFDASAGEPFDAATIAGQLAGLLDSGVRCVSILGGEPTIQTHALLDLAAAADRPLPLAINTNLLMSREIVRLLEGVVERHLADLKFGNDGCAARVAGVSDYVAVTRRNIVRIRRSARVIIRHLLLPNHFDCCFTPIVNWLAEAAPGARFELHPGYVPCGPAARDPDIGRLVTRADVARACSVLAASGLRWSVHGLHNPARLPVSCSSEAGAARVTIGGLTINGAGRQI